MQKNVDFAFRLLHRSLCFLFNKNRDILTWIIFLFPVQQQVKRKSIFFYDSKHDILLESRGMNKVLFIDIPGQKSRPLDYEATCISAVVNYTFLCSDPHESFLQVPRVMFCEHGHALTCMRLSSQSKMSDQMAVLRTLILLILKFI